MRRILSAAATATASFSLFAAGAFASQAETAPAGPLAPHAAAAIAAADLGLDAIDVPALPEAEAPPAVATHSGAPLIPAPASGPVQADGGAETGAPAERDGRSLVELVADLSATETSDAETDCLARAVYYESKGEPLAGQLSVAEVIINRARSGRFPSTLCGVVRQPSQFSFVRRGHIPTPPRASRDWRVAVAIAEIARRDLADGQAPRALFFHARRVRPGWRLTRIGTVGNHVFYR